MRTPEISIIVPAHNVAEYLDKSIKSLLDQTIADVMEIILVENGSTDGTPDVCRMLSEKYQQVKMVVGDFADLSTARNLGVGFATAPVIGFIDGDDTVSPDMFERLLSAKKQYSADIAYCNFQFVRDGEISQYFLNSGEVIKKSPSEVCYEILMEKGTPASWVRIYDKKFFNNRKFPEGKFYEDHAVMYKWMSEMSKIVCVDAPLYNYCQRSGSITSGTFESIKKSRDYFDAEAGRIAFSINYEGFSAKQRADVLKYLMNNLRRIGLRYMEVLLKNGEFDEARDVYRKYDDIISLKFSFKEIIFLIKSMRLKHKWHHKVRKLLNKLAIDEDIK